MGFILIALSEVVQVAHITRLHTHETGQTLHVIIPVGLKSGVRAGLRARRVGPGRTGGDLRGTALAQQHPRKGEAQLSVHHLHRFGLESQSKRNLRRHRPGMASQIHISCGQHLSLSLGLLRVWEVGKQQKHQCCPEVPEISDPTYPDTHVFNNKRPLFGFILVHVRVLERGTLVSTGFQGGQCQESTLYCLGGGITPAGPTWDALWLL